MAKASSKTAKKKNKPASKVKSIQLKINRVNPDNIRPILANDLLVNHTENEFFLTFSILEPPAILSQEDLGKTSEVSAITRAKIVISPKFLESIIKVLTVNYEKHKKTSKD